MIIDVSKHVEEIAKALDIEITGEQAIAISMVLVAVFADGMHHEQQRVISLLRLYAVNPKDLVDRIRRPIR